MATANLTWTPTPGAISQQLEYSLSPYTTWSTPITLGGSVSTYSLVGLGAGTSYEFRIMATCSAGPSTWTTYGPSTSPCFANATVKFKGVIKNAVNTGTLSSCSVNNVSWGTSNGILFPEQTMSGGYSSGTAGMFNLDGTAVSGWAPTSLTAAPLWKNSPATTTNGRMNACAVSAGSTPTIVNGFIGFAYTYYSTSNHVIYIGVGTNSFGKIKLNGITILDQTTASTDAGVAWKIYPVYVTVGPNFFQLGVTKLTSLSTGVGNGASFGIEIYENTAAQIIAATVVTDLNIVFSTATKAGTIISVGDNYGYSCPLSDYYLDINVPSIGFFPQCVKLI